MAETVPIKGFNKFLGYFSYPVKFLFITLMFLLALSIASYFMLKAQNYTINFSQQELRGNEYQRALRNLLQSVSKYYLLMNAYYGGADELKGEIDILKTMIDADFERLKLVDQKYERLLSTRGKDFEIRGSKNLKPEELQRLWLGTRGQGYQLDQETSRKNMRELINDIRALIVHIGDTSNLILDPDVDTYYLMDSTLIRLPKQQDLIPQLVTIGESVIGNKEMTQEQRAELTYLISVFQSEVTETAKGIKKAYLEDRNIKGDVETQQALEQPVNSYVLVANRFIYFIQSQLFGRQEIVADPGELLELGLDALDSSFSLWDAAIEQMDRLLNIRIQSFKNQQFFSVLVSGLATLIGFLSGLFLMLQISRPLTKLFDATKKLESGDLSARCEVTTYDEVGRVAIAFNQMADTFALLLGQMKKAGIRLATSTSDIASSAQEQEKVIMEQETATKEIDATAREIYETSKQFAETMDNVSRGAEQTALSATAGKESVMTMKELTKQMVEATNDVGERLGVIHDKAGSITNIITTITKVADQTNLLSLNAAIEGEKAGRYGTSFLVIAREIRRLADQTAHATLDIEKMVDEMNRAVSAGVVGVDKFQKNIAIWVEKVASVGEQLAKIIEQVQTQTKSFEEVNIGMKNQSEGAEQIKDAIEMLSNLAAKTTHSIQQFHKVVRELERSSSDLQQVVKQSVKSQL
ncbi:MAG: methyl-accepting chemotaxis protein [Waddliaceae bacterium]